MKKIRVYVRTRPDRDGWQMFYDDPLTRRRRTRMAEDCKTEREALKAAAIWENELRSDHDPSVATNWDRFLNRFEDEYLPSRSKNTRSVYLTILRKFEKFSGKAPLDQITASVMSQFQAWLRKAKMPDTTISTYLRHCRAAFRWAHRMGMMRTAPRVELPRLVVSQLAGGRPVSEAEFKRMVSVLPKVLGNDEAAIESVERLLNGLWLSGLRISEACRLSWTDPPVVLDLETGRFPRIIWHASGHKSRRDERSPITPDFHEMVEKTPVAMREGLVFPVRLGGQIIGQDRISRLISEIGTAAKVRVGDGFATAHDFRRSFATRWSQRLRPVTLKSIMRHSDIKTTLAYYVDLDSDEVGAELWSNSGTPIGTLNRPLNGRRRKSHPKKPR